MAMERCEKTRRSLLLEHVMSRVPASSGTVQWGKRGPVLALERSGGTEPYDLHVG